jgi:hypothetical protein
MIDDVAIWRRILGDAEIQKIYDQGVAGASFDGPSGPSGASFTGISANAVSVTLSWAGGTPPFAVQQKSSLSDANWTTVLVTSNRTATVARAGAAGFFRVSENAQSTALAFAATLTGDAERPKVTPRPQVLPISASTGTPLRTPLFIAVCQDLPRTRIFMAGRTLRSAREFSLGSLRLAPSAHPEFWPDP